MTKKDKKIKELQEKVDMMEEWLYEEDEQGKKEKMKRRLKKMLDYIISFFYEREAKTDEIPTDKTN